MRISDWSSDVCSSDLERTRLASRHIEKTMLPTAPLATAIRKVRRGTRDQRHIVEPDRHTGVRERDTKLEILDHVCGRKRHRREEFQGECHPRSEEQRATAEPRKTIGRASCRERVWQYG